MAYLGNYTQTYSSFINTRQTFNGNDSTTDFTLSSPIREAVDIQVFVSNVRQEPGVAYTVSGNLLQFTEAPPTGTGNIYVVFERPLRTTTLPPANSVDGDALVNNLNYSSNLTLSGNLTTSGANTYFTGTHNRIDSANTVFDGHVLFTGTIKSVGSQTGFGDPLTVDTIATANGVVLGRNTTFDKSTAGRVTNVLNAGGDGFGTSTVTLNFANSNHYYVELANNVTLANPSNPTIGQGGSIVLKQDTTGSRTISFGSNWKFPSGVAPTLSTSANTADRIDYYVSNSFYIHAVATLNLS